MADIDALRLALHGEPVLSRRQKRAARNRTRALSPARIAFKLLTVPIVATVLTVSLYIRTAPYAPGDALRHLVALGGCQAAASVHLAPASVGELGYHARNDPDGDGIACPESRADVAALLPMAEDGAARVTGGAKFVRP